MYKDFDVLCGVKSYYLLWKNERFQYKITNMGSVFVIMLFSIKFMLASYSKEFVFNKSEIVTLDTQNRYLTFLTGVSSQV